MSGYRIETNYGYGEWEVSTYSDDKKMAEEDLASYRENQPQYAHRMVKDKD